jgi:hypothetical protein
VCHVGSGISAVPRVARSRQRGSLWVAAHSREPVLL